MAISNFFFFKFVCSSYKLSLNTQNTFKVQKKTKKKLIWTIRKEKKKKGANHTTNIRWEHKRGHGTSSMVCGSTNVWSEKNKDGARFLQLGLASLFFVCLFVLRWRPVVRKQAHVIIIKTRHDIRSWLHVPLPPYFPSPVSTALLFFIQAHAILDLKTISKLTFKCLT